MLMTWALVSCGSSESAPVVAEPEIVQVQATEVPTIVMVTAVPPTDVPATEIPTATPVPTETVVAVEPTAEIEAYDFYGDYRQPDVTTILATGRPQFINSYTDW